jgi:hypothetical protein
MDASRQRLNATRLLYPAHRTNLITERMQRGLSERRRRAQKRPGLLTRIASALWALC